MTTLQTLTVLGSGVLGSQIAFQAAYFGKDVVLYDINDEILAKLPARWEYLRPLYQRDLKADDANLDAAVSRIRATSDLAEAVADADLIIEAVPEDLEIKRATWAKVGALAPAKTVFATNSSTLFPSDIADSTGRPEKFLAFHFANEVWRNNTGEVMGHDATDPQYKEQVLAFAEEIGMIPIHVLKEQPGYIVNSLLIPLLNAASALWVKGVADIETIDRTWRALGNPMGPFEIYDLIGMETIYHVSSHNPDPVIQDFARRVKAEYLDTGRLGKGAGKGFYDYS